MALQSISGFTPNPFQQSEPGSSVPVPAALSVVATRALRESFSAQSRLNVSPVNLGEKNLRRTLELYQAQLEGQTADEINTQTKFTAALEAIDSADEQLAQIQAIAQSALTATTAERAALQTNARAFIDSIIADFSLFTQQNQGLKFEVQLPEGRLPQLAQVQNVEVRSVTGGIPEGGIDVAVFVSASAAVNTATALKSGYRGTASPFIFAGASALGSVLPEDLQLQVSGNRGTRIFSFTNGTALDDVIDEVNEYTYETGVIARRNPRPGGLQNRVELQAEFYGPEQFVSVTPITGNIANFQGGTQTGLNALAEIFVDGSSIGVIEADGRTFDINARGLNIKFKLYDQLNLGTGFNDLDGIGGATPRPTFTIFPGGEGPTVAAGNSAAVFALPELDVRNLGALYAPDGLNGFDVTESVSRSLNVVLAAREDLADSRNTADFVVNKLLGPRIEASQAIQSRIDEVVAEQELTADTVELFGRFREEARLNTANALLGQVSALLPNAGSILLD